MRNIYVFTDDTLQCALADWKAREIEHNPKQQKTIEMTVVAMIEFFDSEEVKRYKMVMQGDN
jgi:hypothetical protein